MIGIQDFRAFKGLDPIADFFDGTVRSDVINMAGFHKVFFLVYKGVGTTGTSTLTVSACDDNSPLTESAVPFHYRRLNDSNVPGAVTAATASGFATTAGSSDLYLIEVDAKALAVSGYKYVCIKAVEVVNSPVVGCIIGLGVPRYADSSQDITS